MAIFINKQSIIIFQCIATLVRNRIWAMFIWKKKEIFFVIWIWDNLQDYPANTRRWLNVGLTLAQHQPQRLVSVGVCWVPSSMYHSVAEECAEVSCGTVGPKPAPGPGEEVIPGIPPGECCPGWIVQCIPSNCPTQDWDSCSWPKVYNITDETLCCSTFECGQFIENMTMWHGDKFSSGFYSGKVRIKTARNPCWNTVMGEYTTAMIEQYNLYYIIYVWNCAIFVFT